MDEAFKIADSVVRWSTPIIGAFITLLVFIYRSKVKELERLIEDEKVIRIKEITHVIQEMNNYENERKLAHKDLLSMFKEGLKEERIFRTDMIIKQANQIEKIFEKIEDVLVSIGRLDQRLESHVFNQEKICKLNHDK